MTAPITSALLDRAQAAGVDELGAAVLGVLGAAVDSGIITLGDLLDLVHSCATADQLGDALTMLAATADDLPVGCPPGHEHRIFRVVGEREQELAILGGA